jgi:hypothetical protein
LPNFANIQDHGDQRREVCEFQNDEHIDVHGIWITERLRNGRGRVTSDRGLRGIVGHVQVVLEIINLRVDLVALDPKFYECASQYRKVGEPADVVVSQGCLEIIYKLGFRPVDIRSPGVEL